MGLLRSCFVRTQTWLQAGKYVSALVSELPSRNGWSVAEHARDRAPDRAQRVVSPGSRGACPGTGGGVGCPARGGGGGGEGAGKEGPPRRPGGGRPAAPAAGG